MDQRCQTVKSKVRILVAVIAFIKLNKFAINKGYQMSLDIYIYIFFFDKMCMVRLCLCNICLL